MNLHIIQRKSRQSVVNLSINPSKCAAVWLKISWSNYRVLKGGVSKGRGVTGEP